MKAASLHEIDPLTGDLKHQFRTGSIVSTDTDMSRSEEKYNVKNEKIFFVWKKEAEQRDTLHEKAAKKFRRMHLIITIPSIILAAVMSTLTSNSSWSQSELTVSLVFLSLAILESVSALLDFSSKRQKHLDYSARFKELATDIDAELTRGRQYRRAYDVFQTEIKNKYQRLIESEPVLWRDIISDIYGVISDIVSDVHGCLRDIIIIWSDWSQLVDLDLYFSDLCSRCSNSF